jgi:hypothetical protein
MRAINLKEIPPVPEGAMGWRRSLRRGSIYHAHSMGHPICGSSVYLDRNKSEELESLGDMHYWGVCSRCFNKSKNAR